MTYGFIGLGNMAGAILHGMARSGRFERDAFVGFDIDPAKAGAFAEKPGLRALASEREVAAAADVLVLAVKPQGANPVLARIRDAMRPQTLLVTILAGLPLAYYAQRLREGTAVVRALPNVNALAGHSTTALCANAHVMEAQLQEAAAIFGAVGSVTQLAEAHARVFSALTGAAPAFVFQMIDALASAGVKGGLPRGMAQRAAADMLLGSARLVLESGEHPAQLIDRVCSPGGTTIEGMHALKALGFEHAVHAAVNAVMEKDRKLGEQP